MKTLVMIPARMHSTRLPGKPLADIGGVPMVVRVWKRATEAKLGEVIVACDSEEIAKAVIRAGGKAELTNPDLPSGSDRIYRALCEIDTKKRYDVIVNVQGDMPMIDPAVIRQTVFLMNDPQVDIATAAAVIKDEAEKLDPSVVKIALANPSAFASGRALYFSRAPIPHGDGPMYHHIGIYAYRRAALEKFVALPPSPLEQREKLEQLRALEAGMRIDVTVVDTVPLGVDTPEGLEKARKIITS